jgi:hypothetical protein
MRFENEVCGSRLRTYTGLRGMKAKLTRLLNEFEFSTMTSVFPGPVERRERVAAHFAASVGSPR